MNATQRYLERISGKFDHASDYRIAQIMGETRQRISNYRVGRTQFDVKACVKVAELLQLEPMEVLSAVERDRAKSDNDRDFWGSQLKRLGVAGLAGLCVAHMAMMPGEAHAARVSAPATSSTEIYIMRFSRRVRRHLRRWLAELDSPFGPWGFRLV